jgi:hypothetical protein
VLRDRTGCRRRACYSYVFLIFSLQSLVSVIIPRWLTSLPLHPALPINEYFSYFGPEYELDVKSSNMVVRLDTIIRVARSCLLSHSVGLIG